ncbi:MAG: universal stress protein [Planctomycetota bacterium]
MVPDIKKILVPTDFSEGSRIAFEYAFSLAKKIGAGIDLVHICEHSPYIYAETQLAKPGDAPQSLQSYLEKETNLHMKNFMKHLPQENTVTVKDYVVYGNPYEEIVKMAIEKHFDLVVMGTHGRTGVAHLLLGSVAEKVVRYSESPVLTVRVPSQDPRDHYKGKHAGSPSGISTSFGTGGYMTSEPHKF